MIKRVIICILSFWPIISNGQIIDSIFTKEKMLWFVQNYHPIALKSQLLLKSGENTVMSAKGGFDPILMSNLTQKQFDNKDYYNLFSGGLKIPTWFGVEVKAGYEQNSGLFLNNEHTTPQDGLAFGGVSVALGNGLIIDKRRAAIKQAKIFQESTEVQQQSMLNDLYFDALLSYWAWVESYNQLRIYEESVDLARDRFEGVKRTFILGEGPAMDTLEAMIQVQNRIIIRNQYRLTYQKASLELSNYLWFENNVPLEITDKLTAPLASGVPEKLPPTINELDKLSIELKAWHPDLMQYDYKLQSLKIDQKLKAEQLKPTVNLNYNVLSDAALTNITSTQNYKWGADFKIPIFLRQQRGDLRQAEIKIQNTEYDQDLKLLQIQNKVRMLGAEQITYFEQTRLYDTVSQNYAKLLSGEKQKFNLGESSIFLINSRENNLIQARVKYIEVYVKYQISIDALAWATGVLHQQ